MVYSYSKFLQDNKNTSREDGCMTIMNVNFAKNKCIVMNPSGQQYLIDIPILIADMLNGLGHINNASRLRYWPHWDEDYEYQPDDYFTNPSKYIQEVQCY